MLFPSEAAVSDTTADLVIGQSNFGTHASALTQSGLNSPSGVAIDQINHRVYVADVKNNRVLGWANEASLNSGDAATLVIGQADFTSGLANRGATPDANTLNNPQGLAVDTAGNLYVADTNNNRVLVYLFGGIVTPTGTSASIVLGQSNLISAGVGTTAGTLRVPQGVAVDSLGNVYVADTGNNRVLVYSNTPTPVSTGMAATRVLGQSTLFSAGTGTSDSTLKQPQAVAVDSSGNVYVTDTVNNRVLEYFAPILTSSQKADRVLGQADFTSGFPNRAIGLAAATPAANTLRGPRGVAIDSADNVYVADTLNRRVLEYNGPTPLTNGQDADSVFGQTAFNVSLSTCGPTRTASTLCVPAGVALDGDRDLWVADSTDHRVLEYDTPVPSVATTTTTTTLPSLSDLQEPVFVGPSTASVGATILVTDRVQNKGTSSTGLGFSVGFYLSTVSTITTGDTKIGSRLVDPLAAGALSQVNTKLTIPAVSPQTYYLGACADDAGVISESDETNNCSIARSITIAAGTTTTTTTTLPGPDLKETVVVGTKQSGGDLIITDRVQNIGTASTGAGFSVGLFLSTTSPVSTGSINVGSRISPALLPGALSQANTRVALPSLPAGTYYVGACADDPSLITESNEGNNCKTGNSITLP